MKGIIFVLNLLFLLISISSAYNLQDVVVTDNTDMVLGTPGFGVGAGGQVSMTVNSVLVPPEYNSSFYGFLMTWNVLNIPVNMRSFDSPQDCINYLSMADSFVGGNKTLDFSQFSYFEPAYVGFIFYNCFQLPVSFNISISQMNIDSHGNPTYLPIGLLKIPTIALIFTVIYTAIFLWFIIRSHRQHLDQSILYPIYFVIVALLFSTTYERNQYLYMSQTGNIILGDDDNTVVYSTFLSIMTVFITILLSSGYGFLDERIATPTKKLKKYIIISVIFMTLYLFSQRTLNPDTILESDAHPFAYMIGVLFVACICTTVVRPMMFHIYESPKLFQFRPKPNQNTVLRKHYLYFYVLLLLTYMYFILMPNFVAFVHARVEYLTYLLNQIVTTVTLVLLILLFSGNRIKKINKSLELPTVSEV